MPNRKFIKQQIILDAAAANGAGTVLNVQDCTDIILQITGATSPALTVKIAGSASVDRPNFSATATAANHFTYIGIDNYEDGATLVEGDDGIVFTGTGALYTAKVNVDGLNWLTAIVSGYSAGAVTVKMIGFNRS